MPEAIAIAAAFISGTLLGLITFSVKRRWCPTCGSLTWTTLPPPPPPTMTKTPDRGHGR